MIYGMVVLAILGLLLLFLMVRMFLDTKRYTFRNIQVHRKQNMGRIMGFFGSICLLIGLLIYVLKF